MNATTSTAAVETELDQLLREPVPSARERGRTAFDHATGGSMTPLVLFGAGNLGRRTHAALRALGRLPLAFADNNEQLWGTTVDGTPVLSPAGAAARYGGTAVFVVTIWRGEATEAMGDHLARLQSYGCRAVPFLPLFWKCAEQLLPHYAADLPHKVLEQRDAVRHASTLWADQQSREEYLAQVRWRLWGDFAVLPPPVSFATYFPTDLCPLTEDEVFVDCGAFDGDTVASFLAHTQGRFQAVHAFEPDPANFRKLSTAVSRMPERERIFTYAVAAGARSERLRFTAAGNSGSAVGRGESEVDCRPLDEVLSGAQPTYLKMDIEGVELAALSGARQLLAKNRPVLAISSYHQQDHLWRVPALIDTLVTDYGLFLRPHVQDTWDLVCYAIPRERLRTHKVDGAGSR